MCVFSFFGDVEAFEDKTCLTHFGLGTKNRVLFMKTFWVEFSLEEKQNCFLAYSCKELKGHELGTKKG